MAPRMLATVVWAALSAGRRRAGSLGEHTPIFEIRYPDADTFLAGPVVLRAVVDPPSAVESVELLRRRPRSVRDRDSRRSSATGMPARMSSSGRSGSSRTSSEAGGPPRPNRADAGPWRHRKGRRRYRAGDRHGHQRSRRVRRRVAAKRLSRPRGRQAANDHLLCVGRRAAGAGRRRRRQRQHGDGDAEAQASGQGVPRRRAGRQSAHAATGSTIRCSRSRGSPTDPPEVRMLAVDRLAAWGATALYDVIVRSIDTLARARAARRSSCSATARIREAT